MSKAVLEHMDSAPPVWNPHVTIIETVDLVRQYTEEALLQSQTQADLRSTGLTKEKRKALDAMCGLAFRLLRKVRAHARRTDDRELLQAVDYSRSEFVASPESAILERCTIVLDRAQARLAELAAVEVTQEEIDAVAAAIEVFRPLSARQDVRRAHGKTATTSLKDLITKTDEQLANLDDLVEAFVEDEAFKETYRNARRINDAQ